jgi:Ca-activated chloride channel family protein
VSFARSDLLALALLLPALVAFAIWAYARRRAFVARTLGDPVLVRRLGGGDLERFPWRRLFLLCLAAAALGMAAAGPRWGRRFGEEQASAVNVVLALDISKSMLAPDVRPNRLERERLFVRRLLREMAGDRMGMVVFAGRAYVLSPLTVDHSALNLYLDALDPDIVSQGGSSIAAAIAQATDLARASAEAGGDRAVVVVSDGEALEDVSGVRAAAERASRAGVTLFTVGIGTTAGSPVPEVNPQTGEISGYKRDPTTNEVIVSRLGESLLREIAQIGGGRYVNVEDAGALNDMLAALRGLERSALQGGRRIEPRDRFALFVALALLLLTLDAAWPRLAQVRAARRTVMGAPDSITAAASGSAAARASGAFGRVAIVLLLSATLGFGIGDVERGNRLYRAGRYEEAVEAYQAAVRSGKASPQVRYNLGTALLQLGRYEEADQQLQLALEGVDPDLRQRALYNLGNRFLSAARESAEPQAQGPLLEAAVEAYKRALRLEPSDPDAKWNLEMALREQQDQQQQQQPGSSEQDPDQPQQDQQQGGGGSSSRASDQDGPTDPGAADQNQMSRDQADRILSAVEQDERDLTRQKLRKGQRRTPVARDW